MEALIQSKPVGQSSIAYGPVCIFVGSGIRRSLSLHLKTGLMRLLILVALLLLAACNHQAPASQPVAQQPAPVDEVEDYPTKPQPRLKTVILYVGPKEVVAEMAVTEDEQATGMMWRTEMGENEGMIFVSPYPRPHGFWMKNTLVPLSIAYIEPDGTISSIHKMQPKDETNIDSDSPTVQYALEMNQGWFEKNGIGKGVVVATEHGPLKDYFFKR